MCVSMQSVVHNCRFINGDRVTPVRQVPRSLSNLKFHYHTRFPVAGTVSHEAAHNVQEQRQTRCIHHVQTADPTLLPPKLRSAESAVVNNSECDAAYRLNQGTRDLLRP
jgi:hypothetical protein